LGLIRYEKLKRASEGSNHPSCLRQNVRAAPGGRGVHAKENFPHKDVNSVVKIFRAAKNVDVAAMPQQVDCQRGSPKPPLPYLAAYHRYRTWPRR